MAKKSKWKGAALSLLGSIPFAGKVKKGIKIAKKAAKTLQKKVQTTKKKVKASLKKAKNKVKKKKKKKKKKGKVFTKARKLLNNLSKKDMLKKLKKGMKKTVLAAKKIQKKAVKYVKVNAKEIASFAVDMVPYVGTVKGFQQTTTGVDLITISEYESEIAKIDEEIAAVKEEIRNTPPERKPTSLDGLLVRAREGKLVREKSPNEKLLVELDERKAKLQMKIRNEESKIIKLGGDVAGKNNSGIDIDKHVKEEPGSYSYMKVSNPENGAYGKIGNFSSEFNYKETQDRYKNIVGIGGNVSASAVEAGWDTDVIDSNVKLVHGEIEARVSDHGFKGGGEAALIKYEGKSEGFEIFGYEVKVGGSFSAASIGGMAAAEWKNGFNLTASGAMGVGGGFSLEINKK